MVKKERINRDPIYAITHTHEFKLKDLLQVIIGAGILAIPVGYTEETWKLAETLPLINMSLFVIISLTFIGTFVYYNYYRVQNKSFKKHKNRKKHFYLRVILTYVFSFLVVALFMTLIDKAQWHIDIGLALKRVIIVTLPASLSAAVADFIK